MNQNPENIKSSPRRTRQQTRNSPNSKLFNAAWPKPPTNPTKKSHIKTVDHEPFTRSWNEWRQKQSECAVEDMEVDSFDVNTPSSLPNPVATKPSATRSISVNELKPASDGRPLLRARRSQSDQTNPPNSATSPFKPISSKVKKAPEPLTATTPATSSTAISNTKKKASSTPKSLFIVIHVNQVQLGSIKGPATSPVKVYADKFIIQMEDESSKKEISFRVPCKDIQTLSVSLLKKPFILSFATKTIHYISGGPQKTKSKSHAASEMKVCLNLAYDEHVPVDVKDDLKELFVVRLAEQNLWPVEDNKTMVADASEAVNKTPVKREHPKEIEPEEEETKSTGKTSIKKNDKQQTQPQVTQKKEVIEVKAIPPKVSNSEDKKIVDLTDEAKLSPKTMLSVRKRTTSLKISPEKLSSSLDSNQFKVARRCNFEESDSLEERIKTLEHEAAHYQMLAAQQRMIIQSLESNARQDAQQAENYSQMLKEERDVLNEEFTNKQNEITSVLNNLKIEKDLVKALESQLKSCRDEITLKDNIVAGKNDALRVREETILELRSRVRTLSTAEQERRNNDTETVSLEEYTELEQRRQRVQADRDRFETNLQRTVYELDLERSSKNTLQAQFDTLQNENRNKRDMINTLRIDYEQMVRQKDSQIQNLQSTSQSQTSQQVQELRNELENNRIQIEELQSELADTKSQLEIQIQLNTPNTSGDSPSRDWILGRGEITITDTVLGTGAWGNVKNGKFRGTDVAVKQIHLLILSPHNRRLFEREMSIASRCRHPCLVQFIGATNDDGTPLFVMELLKTDLRSVLTRNPLSNDECLNIGYDIIRAIVYLHKSKPVPIIHRDISSSNILLYHGENGWRAKLSDYGAANFLRLSMTRHPGALLYSAPEASTIDQSTKLDVYSFGVLFCEMCTRELPVPENRREQVMSVGNTGYRTLINNCLRRDVEKRLNSSGVLQVFEEWMK